MAAFSSDLANQLAEGPAQRIAGQLGITPAQARNAIATALPLLLGTLGVHASQPQGADRLFGALQEHQGADIGQVLDASLAGHGEGGAILGHVFGDRQDQADQALGQRTGLGQDKAHLLLRWLAPIALAYLARHLFDARHAGTDQAPAAAPTAASPQALGEVLQQETAHVQQQHGGLLEEVLGGLGGQGGALGGLMKMGESFFGHRTTSP